MAEENITYTDNHEYGKPGRAKPNWDEDLRQLIDELDTDVMLRGTDSSKADYEPKNNALYLALDTENIYQGTGNQWEQLDSTGLNPDFTHPTADRVTINNAPSRDNHAVRLQDLESYSGGDGSGGSGDGSGVGGKHSAIADGTTTRFSWDTEVTNADNIRYVSIDAATRAASTDYSRFIDGTSVGVEYDVAPADGEQLSWYWAVNAFVEAVEPADHDHAGDTLVPSETHADFSTHATTIDSAYNVPAGRGTVIAGALEGTGEITGEGSLAGVWDTFEAVTDTAPGDVDFQGHAINNLGSLDTDVAGINQTQVSGRVGDFVYYDPDNPGPYVDGQEAFDDVPSGGTLLLAQGTYTVDTEGPLHTSVPKYIRGVGHGRHDDLSDHGTIIDSSQDAEPPVEFAGGTSRHNGGGIRDVAIKQRAPTTHPIVHIQNMTQTIIADCLISGNGGNVGKAVQYTDGSFFARQYRNHIAGWSDRGISVEGTGYAYEFHQNFVSSASTDHTALYLDVERPLVVGGQYSAVGTGGCAIHLDAESSVKRSGAVVLEPGIESTEYPLRVGGTNPRHGTYARFYSTNHAVSILDLVNSNDGKYYPLYSQATDGQLVDYNTNSVGNLIEVPATHLNGMTIAGTPSNTELIHARGSVWEDQLAGMPTGGVRILCDMSVNQGAPIWHDKTDWRVASSTAFTPA